MPGQLREVEKVSPEVLKQAAMKLSDGKGDPVSSDCIKHGSDVHLSTLL